MDQLIYMGRSGNKRIFYMPMNKRIFQNTNRSNRMINRVWFYLCLFAVIFFIIFILNSHNIDDSFEFIVTKKIFNAEIIFWIVTVAISSFIGWRNITPTGKLSRGTEEQLNKAIYNNQYLKLEQGKKVTRKDFVQVLLKDFIWLLLTLFFIYDLINNGVIGKTSHIISFFAGLIAYAVVFSITFINLFILRRLNFLITVYNLQNRDQIEYRNWLHYAVLLIIVVGSVYAFNYQYSNQKPNSNSTQLAPWERRKNAKRQNIRRENKAKKSSNAKKKKENLDKKQAEVITKLDKKSKALGEWLVKHYKGIYSIEITDYTYYDGSNEYDIEGKVNDSVDLDYTVRSLNGREHFKQSQLLLGSKSYTDKGFLKDTGIKQDENQNRKLKDISFTIDPVVFVHGLK